ncbi:hypothetical protein D349_00917 [Enterococcus faecalis UP2S-6]|nr:hypothetical protein D349_00917 [Enterococcus faecalis UP2S-6]
MIKASADVEKNQELLKFFHLFLSESDLSDFFQKVKAFSSTTMKKKHQLYRRYKNGRNYPSKSR